MTENPTPKTTVISLSKNFKKQLTMLLCTASVILLFSLLFVPFCVSQTPRVSTSSLPYPGADEFIYTTSEFIPSNIFSDNADELLELLPFLGVAAMLTVGIIFLFKCINSYKASDLSFFKYAHRLSIATTAFTGAYFVSGVAYSAIQNSNEDELVRYSSSSYTPFIISVAICLLIAILSLGMHENSAKKLSQSDTRHRTELFCYGTLISLLTVIASLTDILKVSVYSPKNADTLYLNGFDLFNSYNSLEGEFQLIAFILFTVLTVTISLFVVSLFSFIRKSDVFYKVFGFQAVSGICFSLAIGLSGKYYEIVQKINEETVFKWISDELNLKDSVYIDYKVTSSSFVYFIIIMLIVAVMLLRKTYSKCVPEADVKKPKLNTVVTEKAPTEGISVSPVTDPCPAFSELDSMSPVYDRELEDIKEKPSEAYSLPSLVRFVVDYARNSRLHLSYTPEDIATFIAGLGATRLTILQGMSGTGKTSLPKIFTEAVFGNCELIEVESSWRDKNELLGYYNEFSRTYTPKKFTQALYKANLNPGRLTLIVLDEMNLSRVEYYFSDFLSLMENEEHLREIKLLNTQLYRNEDGEFYPYSALVSGHTLKIPPNVWFIGTANRDESTFEISDKVYDRAHTMNFNKRASKITSYGDPLPSRYLSPVAFLAMLNNAKASFNIDIANHPTVRAVEELLAPYNISFGNRIANQMEAFVSIYCACFDSHENVLENAIEKILLSKVVAKLEYKSIEDKDELAASFGKLGLERCRQFILKLNED